jgi:hypothetical protein
MRKRSMAVGRAGLVVGATVLAVVTLTLQASLASASTRAVDKDFSFSCPAAGVLNFATAGNYGAPKESGGPVKGGGVCTYTAVSGGATYVIARAPLGKSKFRNVAKAVLGHDHLTSVSGIGKAAIHGTGSLDVLLVQQGSVLYEFLDKSGTSTLKQLEAMAKVTVPK